MLDAALATLYGVETRALNQAVRRNIERFPEDFLFELTEAEATSLRSQIVILETGRGRHSKYSALAFTEQGVAMLSSVLRSKRAIEINIEIMRTFVRIRHVLAENTALARKVAEHDQQITVLFDHVRQLLSPLPAKKLAIGFPANLDITNCDLKLERHRGIRQTYALSSPLLRDQSKNWYIAPKCPKPATVAARKHFSPNWYIGILVSIIYQSGRVCHALRRADFGLHPTPCPR